MKTRTSKQSPDRALAEHRFSKSDQAMSNASVNVMETSPRDQRAGCQSRSTPMDAFCASNLWTAGLLGPAFFGHCRNPTRAAAAYLGRRLQSGLVASAVVDACPTPDVVEPLHAGRPGQAPYRHLAREAEKRWAVPSVPQRVYWATSRFARLYGTWTGQDEFRRPELASHDLLLSAVWLVYLRRNPEIALRHWKSERRLEFAHRRGRRLRSIPDALITTPRRTSAVEVLGQYPAEWIAHHCRRFRAEHWHVVIW